MIIRLCVRVGWVCRGVLRKRIHDENAPRGGDERDGKKERKLSESVGVGGGLIWDEMEWVEGGVN